MTRVQTKASTVPASSSGRSFRLTVLRTADDAFGLSLEETYDQQGLQLATHAVSATPAQVGRVIDAVLAAVRGSGHAPSSLAATRKKAIRLEEAEGVRLVLILLTTQPLNRHDRVRAVVAGLNAMSVEETYYWYAKCLSPEAARARRALRILLADV